MLYAYVDKVKSLKAKGCMRPEGIFSPSFSMIDMKTAILTLRRKISKKSTYSAPNGKLRSYAYSEKAQNILKIYMNFID